MRPARIDHPMDVIRPLAWIAAVSFATGFWGFLAFNPVN
jgi:hypothetical protein